MRRVGSWVARSLFIRLFLTMMAALLFFLGGLSALVLSQLNAHLAQSQAEDMDLHLTRATMYINLYVQSIKDSMMLMSYDPGLYGEDPAAVRRLLQRYAQSAVQRIGGIYLRYEDGEIICTDQVIFDTMDYEPPTYLGSAAEGIRITAPYFSRMAQERTAALLLPLLPGAGGARELICEIKLRALMRGIQNTLGKYPAFALLSMDNQIITYNINALTNDANTVYLDARMQDALADQLRQVRLGQRTLMGEKDAIEISMGVIEQAGWKLIIMVGSREMRAQARTALFQILRMLPWAVPALLLLNMLIARRFTRPIRTLCRQMDGTLPLAVGAEVTRLSGRTDEMGQLAQSFVSMTARIMDLQTRELETEKARNALELRLLQSQIYPHFFSNSLNCIVLLLLKNDQARALATLRQLIHILSYGIDHLDDRVTLGQELDFVEAYVGVHKVRKGDSFSYVCDVPEEYRQVSVPKLLLQPFVENSLFHGFAEARPGQVLSISAKQQDKRLRIFIRDNGRGIAPGELLRLRRFEDTPGARRGIGIGNVAARMQLCYGPQFGIDILSQPGEGTVILLDMPLYGG